MEEDQYTQLCKIANDINVRAMLYAHHNNTMFEAEGEDGSDGCMEPGNDKSTLAAIHGCFWSSWLAILNHGGPMTCTYCIYGYNMGIHNNNIATGSNNANHQQHNVY